MLLKTKNIISLFTLLFISLASNAQSKIYSKKHNTEGKLIAEGWITNDSKTGYWISYHENGIKKSEGHYSDNTKNNYWIFYNSYGQKTKEGWYNMNAKSGWWVYYTKQGDFAFKTQYKQDLKNGYELLYKNNKIYKIEKYSQDNKVGSWTDVKKFKKENNLSDLR